MTGTVYKMRARVWLYPGIAAWHMVTLLKNQSGKIKQLFAVAHRGWSSLPVIVRLEQTIWNTSIFFDKKAGAYLLPLKAEVRKKEHILAGDTVSLLLEIKP